MGLSHVWKLGCYFCAVLSREPFRDSWPNAVGDANPLSRPAQHCLGSLGKSIFCNYLIFCALNIWMFSFACAFIALLLASLAIGP